MFVKSGAKLQLLKERQSHYREQFVLPLLEEAKRIGLSKESVVQLILEEE